MREAPHISLPGFGGSGAQEWNGRQTPWDGRGWQGVLCIVVASGGCLGRPRSTDRFVAGMRNFCPHRSIDPQLSIGFLQIQPHGFLLGSSALASPGLVLRAFGRVRRRRNRWGSIPTHRHLVIGVQFQLVAVRGNTAGFPALHRPDLFAKGGRETRAGNTGTHGAEAASVAAIASVAADTASSGHHDVCICVCVC